MWKLEVEKNLLQLLLSWFKSSSYLQEQKKYIIKQCKQKLKQTEGIIAEARRGSSAGHRLWEFTPCHYRSSESRNLVCT